MEKIIRAIAALFLAGCLSLPALAEESSQQTQDQPASLLARATTGASTLVMSALELVGIRYRRGGSSPETGFDCSGFVDHVFREGLGMILPHNASAMSKSGEKIGKNELQPGDLVFFNTMRRAFSHVGIYLGDNRFVHAPASGGEVRVEDMSGPYWAKRFNGARRMTLD